MEMTGSRWVWLFVIVFISSILIFALNDREKPPEMSYNATTNTTAPLCDEDFQYIAAKNTCYRENPLGHTVMTFTQILASIFTIGLITVYEFKDWRIYLSSKLLPYRNKYQETLTPITKCPDMHKKAGLIWTREGFDALMASTSNNIYVSREDMTAKISHNLILKGEIQQVSHQYLYEYTGFDLNLCREITENPLLTINKRGKIENLDKTIKIFLTIPITNNEELKGYGSISGFFGFGADRFDMVILGLFKMRKGLIGFGQKLNKASEFMLDSARAMSQSTAVIADAVGRTQNSEGSQMNQPQENNNQEQQRRNI
jgi:hypothetical protein